MEQHTPKPGDRYLHARRVKSWQVTLVEKALPTPKKFRASPLLRLVWGFAGIIILGALLLMLPISTNAGHMTNPVDALFAATSAVCVTGLVVVDTADYWSGFGQFILLLLFQVGGLGFMISATMVLLAAGRRIHLKERLLLGETLGLDQPGGVVRIARRVALFTAAAEGIGALILFVRFIVEGISPGKALWSAIFHAVSAFNNCGMDIMGGFRSLSDFKSDPVVILVIALLIIFGGLGYIVVDDVLRQRNPDKLKADSKMVLATTGGLLLVGTILIFALEYSNPATLGPLSLPQKLLASFFQAVVPRTAGFSVVDIASYVPAILFFTMFLMLIGGGSGSTAGGIKVNTFGLILAATWSALTDKESAEGFDRSYTSQNVIRALSLATIYVAIIFLVVLLLSVTETFAFDRLFFEATSALGTVGLTTGITPGLSTAGRIIIILAMVIGRLGPLTLASTIVLPRRGAQIHFPVETIRIG